MTPEQFLTQFRSKTLAYLPTFQDDRRPVVVILGEDAHSVAGHTLIVGFANQAARAHQHLVILGDLDRPSLSPGAAPGATLRDATLGLARAINPFIEAGNTRPATEALVTIGVGQTAGPVDLRVGCEGWYATFGDDARIGHDHTSILGAMLAATIAAGFAFHRLLGSRGTVEGCYSLWDFGKKNGTQGPPLTGPLDVGRVLQVGGGGVGSALDFWLSQIGIASPWVIVDGDDVDVSNLNRQLTFIAAHAGYPSGKAANKAVTAAAPLPSATADAHWYGETQTVTEAEYDVVLALANEHHVRSVLQARQPTVLLHATTSPNWEAQFHRHLAGLDDCITCRIPEAAPVTRCAEGEVDAETSSDAALPFLSAAAGLLLLAGLLRLQHGELAGSPANFASLNFREPDPVLQLLQRLCRDGCTGHAPPATRRAYPRTRFAMLDPALA